MYSQVIQEMQAVRAAEAAVAPLVGPVLGMDSEAAVYKEALCRMGYGAEELKRRGLAADQIRHPDGATFRALFQIARGRRAVSPNALAMDAKALAGFAQRFPNAAPFRSL